MYYFLHLPVWDIAVNTKISSKRLTKIDEDSNFLDKIPDPADSSDRK
jgi:hypothetical protein